MASDARPTFALRLGAVAFVAAAMQTCAPLLRAGTTTTAPSSGGG